MNNLEKIVREKAVHVTTLEELQKKLKGDNPLRIKYGIDPTNPNIHLGHTVPLRLLKKFQDDGHKAIIILGDYTASLGDPSGRDSMRKGIDLEQARKNCSLYINQLKKLISTDASKCEIHYNSHWLQNMLTTDWMKRLRNWTVQQIMERDDFKKRVNEGVGVHLTELFYPLMQGEDSVRIKADVELGGSEQLFTLQMGREMQKMDGQSPQVCITLPILRGLDGTKRMGKSLGNFVGIEEDPFEQFSKVMSIPDALMPEWFDLLTDENCSRIMDSVGPMETKKQLAHLLVGGFHGPHRAIEAEKRWTDQFSLRKTPETIREIPMWDCEASLATVLTGYGIVKSKNNAKRLIEQGAVQVDGIRVVDPKTMIKPEKGMVIKCGRNYLKVS